MSSETHCFNCETANSTGSEFCRHCGAALPGGVPAAGEPGAEDWQPARFWERLLAWTVDCFLLFVVSLGVLALLPGVSMAEYFTGEALWLKYNALFWGLSVPYETISVWLFATTVGKRILGLYVRQTDGGKVGLKTALLRGLVITVSRLAFTIGPIPVGFAATVFGLFTMGFTNNRPGLHNQICETMVLERRRR